jgi:hypothetical protein
MEKDLVHNRRWVWKVMIDFDIRQAHHVGDMLRT